MDANTKKLYELKAEILAAAGNPIRLAIIDFLKDGEQCVCDITLHVEAKRSNISRHLSVLTRTGIIGYRKEGLRMMYCLKTPCILSFMKCVEGILHQQAQETRLLLEQAGNYILIQ